MRFDLLEENSSGGKIFLAIKTALNFISVNDFKERVSGYIFSNSEITLEKKLAIKIGMASMPNTNNSDSINKIITFILYGSYKDIGIEEDSLLLTDEEREKILSIFFNLAKKIVQEKVIELNEVANLEYEVPDWKIS